MSQHIGIVACSAEGAALCYRTICLEGEALLGVHKHPEVSMHTHCLGDYMNAIYENDWQQVANLMLSSAQKLAAIGADFLICPDNTIHEALNLVLTKTPLPWLHIAEEVGKSALASGYSRLAILGTKYLMEGPVYPQQLNRLKIESMVPDLPDREKINAIIFEELVKGRFSLEARSYMSGVIQYLKRRGCDSVVLGCTEIPILISQEDSELPVLDSTRLLARAALKKAVENSTS
jgi:aspartate racemase